MSLFRPRALRIAALIALLPAAPALAYTVLTLDGHRIEALDKPEVIGLQARLRMAPSGLLVVILEERIDWKRTEQANAGTDPERKLLVVPADTQMAGSQPASTPQPPAPIEMKIEGGAVAQSAPPAITPSELAPDAQEELARLADEQTRITAILEESQARKKSLDEETARIKNRPEAQASLSREETRRLRELEKQTSQAQEAIKAA